LTLIKQYGSIEGILEALDELTPARRKRIEEGIDMLHLSRKLAEIHCDLDVSCQIEDLTLPIYDTEKRSLFEKEGYTLLMRHADSLFS
jgi:5'-3' exonuclease